MEAHCARILLNSNVSPIDADTYVVSYKGTFDGTCTMDGKTEKSPEPYSGCYHLGQERRHMGGRVPRREPDRRSHSPGCAAR